MTQVTIPFQPAERSAMAERWNTHPGMVPMGARADFSDPTEVQVVIQPILPVHRGGLGTEAVNGAVIAGLVDVAIGMVGHFQTAGRRAGTAQLGIHYVRPVLGDRISVHPRLVRAGSNLVFAAAEVLDATGTLCARGDGIVAVSGTGIAEKEVAL